jgi:hypothetical protein
MNNRARLRTGIRERTESFLHKNLPAAQCCPLVNFREPAFTSRTKSNNAVSGRRPTSRCRWSDICFDGYQLSFLAGDNAGNVFLQFVVVRHPDQVLPTFGGPNHDTNANLRAGVCHGREMPHLTELKNLFLFGFYKDIAPAALPLSHQNAQLL